MRVHQLVLAATIALSIPSIAASQANTPGTTPGTTAGTSPGSGQTGTTGGTGPGTQTGTPGTTAAGQTTSSGGNGWLGSGNSHWIASGFVGSDFGLQATGSSVDFGGSLGYLWNNWVGGEFLANFAPDFQLQSTAPNAFLLNGSNPAINTYMANAVGAIPIGANSTWQPFVSGGFGAITLRSDLSSFSTGVVNPVASAFNSDETRFGGNIGVGVLAFIGDWGIRGDVRYFRAFSRDDTNTTTVSNGTTTATSDLNILPGLDFWRANIGVAFRW